MAAMPPPMPGPGGIAPPRPPLSMVPEGAPPPMQPGQAPPGPPMAPPAPPPMGGLGPASPLVGMLSDLPTNLTPGWQCVDMSIRCLRTALRSADMQRAEKVVAALQSVLNVQTKLLSAYTAGAPSGGADATPSASADDGGGGQPNGDADSQPSSASMTAGDE